MHAYVAAGAGFLLSVLWFDLMFDVQVRGHDEAELPEDVLTSITGYYARATIAARPMNRLIAVVMLGTLAAIVVQIANADAPRWAGWVSLPLVLVPVVTARVRTVPNAVRLGSRRHPVGRQSELARALYVDHLVFLVAIAAVLVVQLATV